MEVVQLMNGEENGWKTQGSIKVSICNVFKVLEVTDP